MQGLKFTVYCTPVPQGSKRGWVVPGKNGAKPRAIIADDNNKTKPYRQMVTQTIRSVMQQYSVEAPWAIKHTPVRLGLRFYFLKPPSAKKSRFCPVVKPDLDKLIRSTMDSMTGMVFVDDAQVVELEVSKHYGTPERVEIVCLQIDAETLRPISDDIKALTVSV
jgi:Holliday junction resolvase RusA-like endonuclease